MKYKIALITVYFGRFPNYFNLWLKSAEKNPDVDFIIVTDSRIQSECKNIKVVRSTLEQVKKRADIALRMNCVMSNPYKLCDYKPAYGLLFSDLLEEYDFWGHCDVDVVWGDIRKFVTDDILAAHNKIFNLGHLTLYKNDKETNEVFKKLLTGVHYTYIEAFRVKFNTGFDEKGAVAALSVNGNYKMYDNKDIIADIWPDTKRYKTFYTLYSDYDHIYGYENGKLIGYFIVEGEIKKKEFLYIHLQKRTMLCKNSSDDKYLIVPDEFIDCQDVSVEFIKRYSSDMTPIEIVADLTDRHMPLYISVLRKLRRLLFAHWLKVDQC